MADYRGNNSNHDQRLENDSNVSNQSDSSRQPQLNPAVPAQGGRPGQNNGQSDSDGNGGGGSNGSAMSFTGGHVSPLPNGYTEGDNDDASELGDAPFDYDEGVEDSQRLDPVLGQEDMDVTTPGCPCSCHWMRRTPLFDYSPPSCSGMHSPASSAMAVRDSSGERSLENSVMWNSPSPVHSEQNFFVRPVMIDETAFQHINLLRFSLVHNPLALSPESIFAYPTTVNISEENGEGEWTW